jgi:hypothetical protein
MNLADMRDLVERDLHDETNAVWTTDELDRAIQLAVQEFSYAIPVEDSTTESSVSSRDIDISALSTRVMIQAVEYPTGNYPKTYVRFSIWGDTLTLLVDTEPDGTYDAEIYYGKMHTLNGSSSTIPSIHENLIAKGAQGFALTQWAADAINRTNVGGSDVAATYERQGHRLLQEFRKELKRLGRQNRVRIRQLYAPYYPIVSKNTVVGPK